MRKRFLMFFIFGAIAVLILPIRSFSQTEGAAGSVKERLESAIDSRVFANLPKATKKTPKKTTPPKKTTVAKTPTKTKTKKPVNNPRVPAEEAEEVYEPEEVAATVDRSVLTFKPNSNLGVDRLLADSFGNTPQTRQAAMTIFKQTMSIYQAGATKRGRSNDLGWAVTFFVVNCLNVYHDAPQPSEAAVQNTYEIVSDLMAQSPDIAKASDKEKQVLHDMLVYIAGTVVAVDSLGKTNNQPKLSASARETAGEALQAVIGISPNRMSFSNTGLVVK